jgi:hypothetical protein
VGITDVAAVPSAANTFKTDDNIDVFVVLDAIIVQGT